MDLMDSFINELKDSTDLSLTPDKMLAIPEVRVLVKELADELTAAKLAVVDTIYTEEFEEMAQKDQSALLDKEFKKACAPALQRGIERISVVLRSKGLL